jgi:hypothetical protein
MRSKRGKLGVGNELQRVSASSVLGDANVIKINGTSVVVNNILNNSAKLNCIVNLGLAFLGKSNALGIATSFNVEDTLIGPNVLVITNEKALRVSRQSCLSSSRETKEEGGGSIFALIARGVKGQDPTLHHEIHHNGQDSLFHLTSVFGSKNDHLTENKQNKITTTTTTTTTKKEVQIRHA